MMRWDKIMLALEAGLPYEQIADMYHTDAATIRVYDLVRLGKTSNLGVNDSYEKSPNVDNMPGWEVDEIKKLLADGKTLNEISKGMRLSKHSVEKVKKHLHAQGFRTPREQKLERANAVKDRIIEEYYKGKRWGEIGEIVDMTADEVRCVLYRFIYNGKGEVRRREKHG